MNSSHSSADQGRPHHHGSSLSLIVAALGVVFGDIGTSPIYTLKECFSPESPHHIEALPANIIGVVSLIIWSIVALICVKYLVFVLRADNKGEGGVLSLMALAAQGLSQNRWQKNMVMCMGLVGAALLFGDGMITPAISVLSAVEGLRDGGVFGSPPTDAAKVLEWSSSVDMLIMGITVVILILLFCFQFFGTARVGKFFGPITLLWFVSIGLMGLFHVVAEPGVLAAFNPVHGFRFLLGGEGKAFLLLGSVFLAVTGGEALYADMGHFGAGPIRRGWFTVVFPSLLLNYLGQGALLIKEPSAAVAPFFHMVTGWCVLPLVILATAATVIASQALITGTYSLTLSAVQLGYLPRVSILHTSEHSRGQIYVPLINWGLMLACIALVCLFKSSTNLAAAYGVAVTMTMLITTILFYFVARDLWSWPLWKIIPVCAIAGMVEICFLGANLAKFFDGGWLPLAVGVVVFLLMTTWEGGRCLVRRRLEESGLSQELLIESLQRNPPVVVEGTAVFMSSSRGRAPIAMLHNLKHNRVIHKRVVFLTIMVEDDPWVRPGRQVDVEDLGHGFWRVTGHYGFMQRPNVPRLLRLCGTFGVDLVPEECTFFMGREVIVPSGRLGMAKWREHLFAVASKLAEQPASYFQIPIGRVIELGQQVEI